MSRPTFQRQRSNSVPVINFANVTAAEAGLLFSTAERAAARRKRPVSVDSPGPVMNHGYDPKTLLQPNQTFNFSTPSRLGISQTPLRSVQRSESIKSLPPTPRQPSEEEETEEQDSTPIAEVPPPPPPKPSHTTSMPSPPSSPRRHVENPALKAYADSLLQFTQARLNVAKPDTLQTLGLRRERSSAVTPELEVSELPKPRRPFFQSRFSDWSSTAASSMMGPSSPPSPSPSEPQTPDDQCGLMTPDSFFAEVTPRVAQTAHWAEMMSGRPSSSVVENPLYLDSPFLTRARTDSVTSTDVFSYFSGFDGVTAAAESRWSNDFSPTGVLRNSTIQNHIAPRSQPVSAGSSHPPYIRQRYADMAGLARTPSWHVSAVH